MNIEYITIDAGQRFDAVMPEIPTNSIINKTVTPCCLFEHHTFLHHSQTELIGVRRANEFEHHTFLHHSQTRIL